MPDLRFEISGREFGRGASNVKWNLNGDVGGVQTFQDLIDFVRGAQIAIARDVLNEELNRGFPKDYITIVDGRVGLNEEAVKPFGRIEYAARLQITEVVDQMWETVLRLSKVVTGEYIGSHVMTYNGNTIARTPSEARVWAKAVSVKNGDRIRMVNTAPYARRLELLGVTAFSTRRKSGKSSNKKRRKAGIIVRKPNGTYYQSFLSLNRLVSKGVGKFKYENVSGGEIGITGKGREFSTQSRGNNRPYVYPSILFKVGEGTVQ
jgi:hypothetical protein